MRFFFQFSSRLFWLSNFTGQFEQATMPSSTNNEVDTSSESNYIVLETINHVIDLCFDGQNGGLREEHAVGGTV